LTDTDRLKKINAKPVFSCFDDEFKSYGRVLRDMDISDMKDYMGKNTEIPDDGNIYVASDSKLEECKSFAALEQRYYGGLKAQAGYCNGRNVKMNGFEFHRGSEINCCVNTDIALILGHTWDVTEDGKYDQDKAEIFIIPKDIIIEIYETTLHLSPCRTSGTGFKTIVILPENTNTYLDKNTLKYGIDDKFDKLLFMKNKWMIASVHNARAVSNGAFPGVEGENYEFKY